MALMKRAPLVSLSLLLVAACSAPEITPESGTWDFVEGAAIESSCGDMVDLSSGLFELVNNDDGTFTVNPSDSAVSFDCELDDDAGFTCPERLQTTLTSEDIEATIEIRLRESGKFSSNTAASGRRDGAASCTGAGCSLVGAALGASFPCTAAFEFTATFVE